MDFELPDLDPEKCNKSRFYGILKQLCVSYILAQVVALAARFSKQ